MDISGGLSRNPSRSSLQLMLIQWLTESPVRMDNQSQDRPLQPSEPRLNYAQIGDRQSAEPSVRGMGEKGSRRKRVNVDSLTTLSPEIDRGPPKGNEQNTPDTRVDTPSGRC
jgi:hypothetical protein